MPALKRAITLAPGEVSGESQSYSRVDGHCRKLAVVYGGNGPRPGVGNRVVDEHELLREFVPRYEGHRGHKYALPDIDSCGIVYDGKYTTDSGWDDRSPEVGSRYAKYARYLGIDTLIFTLYGGVDAVGNQQILMEEPLLNFIDWCSVHESRMSFAPLLCTRLFRQRFPQRVPWRKEAEVYRYRYVNPESFAFLAQHALASYYQNHRRNFMQIDGKPVLFLYDFVMMAADNNILTLDIAQRSLDDLREFSHRNFGVEPVFVSVVHTITQALGAQKMGVDIVTNYIDLPSFSQAQRWPVQDYAELVAERLRDWVLFDKLHIPFIPSLISGFDASCRASPQGAGRHIQTAPYPEGNWYPLIPHIPYTFNRPKQYREFVRAGIEKTTQQHLPFINFGPLNEMTEQCCVLPTYEDVDGFVVYKMELGDVIRTELALAFGEGSEFL